MEYLPGMEIINSDVRSKVLEHMNNFDYSKYTGRDVMKALEHETCSIGDFKALLSPAAEPFLELMAQRASRETSKHFGNTVYMFTPLYIANYCENYCVYCGFNCYNHINRMKLSAEQIEKEMKVIADSGMEEILILTGESRSQILSLMNAPDIETLRTQAGQVWNANYCDDGAIKSVLANSVWLSDSLETNSGTIGTLAKSYYASVHSGEFGSDEMTQAIRGWLNEQTGGMLNDAVSDVAPDASTLMALYSTVWFKGRWDNEFNKQLNDTRTFHAPSGDVQAEFMNQSFDRSYYWGEDFGAVKQPFVSGCDMWLILPDEDKSVSDVLDSGNYLSLLTDGYDYENSRTMKVNLALPKFDVTSTIDLMEGLTELGITDVFSENADFSELCSSELYVNSARQSARVTIDEEGCTAAAFTEMLLCGSACPPANIQEIDFVLDRPFLFVITGLDGQPLFVGTVFNV